MTENVHIIEHIKQNERAESDHTRRIRLVMQLRRSGIRDTRVLSAIESIPREEFVEEAFHDQAYVDTALPIACGQTISQPTIVAWMTSMLEVQARHTVLEIGTGCGYQTAILAQLARRVYTIERHRPLMAMAEPRLQALGFTNVVTRVGNGWKGWKESAPFDRILVAAAPPEVPEALIEQLRPGGVMVIPVGEETGEQQLLRLRKAMDGVVETEALMPVRFVPLVRA